MHAWLPPQDDPAHVTAAPLPRGSHFGPGLTMPAGGGVQPQACPRTGWRSAGVGPGPPATTPTRYGPCMPDAVILPGGRYPATAPLTMYAGDVAERRGARVHRHS